MTDRLARAREMVLLLERGDASAAASLFSERIRGYIAQGWSLEEYARDDWHPALDDLAGSSREITGEQHVSATAARFTLDGDRGRAVVTIPFDDDGGIGGLSIERDAFEGIGTIVITCPDDRRDELSAFYGGLLGKDRWRVPRLRFDEGENYRAPVWGDPERPQQIHLDIFVRDLDEASGVAERAGAYLLQDVGAYRTYADPIGHAVCLDPSARADGEHAGVLGRVVIDCSDPSALAPFYEALLDMPNRIEDTRDRIVIARHDERLPMLAFQRVVPYIAPRWPDPAFPPQMHFDLKVDDRRATTELVERLGAIRLPDQGGSCPVYADPAGHPFCLCMHGQ